ncbi:MAG: 3'(2'),5'-bisphosphate nucleotidase CysQ family protein, partial [Gemmatimonadota bacterium]
LEPYLEDLRLAARAALAGGAAALAHYGEGGLEIEHKAADDPVTAADHASNAAILGMLRTARPLDPILSEESYPPDAAARPPRRLWVVDPLDGTKEFIARNDEFSVMVGLAVRGSAALGAVYQPAADRLFVGVTDRWAAVVAEPQQNGPLRRLWLSDAPAGGGPIRVAISRSHSDERLRALADALGDVETVVSGSVGIKCALVAAGRADLYVHPVPLLKEWDTCAPEAVLRGAGGRVTDCAGHALAYGKADPRQRGGIFAARADVWRRVEPTVREATRGLFDEIESGRIPD